MYLQKINVYCDMDGVLADFNGKENALQRFETEIAFFQTLKPIKNNVKALNELIDNPHFNVFILSASPNEQADKDKYAWLMCVFGRKLKKSHIIIMRCGENKADYVKTTNNNILFDDYGKNCIEFARVGKAYKIDKWHSIKRYMRTLEK